MSPIVMTARIKRIIYERTGLVVNPHLFRALAGKLYLDQHPGGYEVVRRMLGHKSLSTTLSVYTGAEAKSAAKHFDETIQKIRATSALPHRARRLGGAKGAHR
jgi:integrase